MIDSSMVFPLCFLNIQTVSCYTGSIQIKRQCISKVLRNHTPVEELQCTSTPSRDTRLWKCVGRMKTILPKDLPSFSVLKWWLRMLSHMSLQNLSKMFIWVKIWGPHHFHHHQTIQTCSMDGAESSYFSLSIRIRHRIKGDQSELPVCVNIQSLSC